MVVNMASRMEKYRSKHNDTPLNRSKKNEDIYKQIQEYDTYTNIEGVATIDKNNEIEISKVKEMIKNRENYRKERFYNNIVKKEVQKSEEDIPTVQEENKIYDLKDLISQAKENTKDEKDKYRNLSKIEYNVEDRISPKAKEPETDEEELKELIYTISNNKMLNQLANDDVGLLDELKSNTMVGESDSIKKYVEEAKFNSETKLDQTLSKTDSKMENSFFTSSMSFSNDDFDDFQDLKPKKLNLAIKITLVLFITLVLIIVAFLIYKYLWS